MLPNPKPKWQKCTTVGCGCDDGELFPVVADSDDRVGPVVWRRHLMCIKCGVREAISDEFPRCERCAQGIPDPIQKSALPGRNEPCPCKSGKKFKKCCLKK